jgi:flagellar basal-body rod modification protein FlgD
MVEQSVQQSTTLGNIQSQLQTLSGSQATALVGKQVTVNNTGMQWDGTFATTANVTLAGPAQSVSVAVQDSQGNTVRTMALGAQQGGVLPITWDGKTDAGQAAPAGSYSINVTATGANQQAVAVSQTVSGQVTQVSLNNGVASLTLSNGTVVPLSQLTGVSLSSAAASK